MRIIQMIDSLEVGGAEKMAVNYANALSSRIEFSGLVATRKEGNLKVQIKDTVSYLFLERKKTIDFAAILKLKKYCKENNIDFIQAHGTSFFTAFLTKVIYFKVKIIWHDHYGLSEYLAQRKSFLLKMVSFFFSGIATVNTQLKEWSQKELNCNKVKYFPNFTSENDKVVSQTTLNGKPGNQILCLANLRQQKNHFLLIEVAKKLKNSNPDWTFHLVGKNFNDDYSKQVSDLILKNSLEENVFLYGTRNDIQNIINQAEICILTSNSEGLPVALLEYGMQKKAVLSTSVGEIPLILENAVNGFLVPVDDVASFYQTLIKLINNKDLRIKMGLTLQKTIAKNNSEISIMNQYIDWIKLL